MRKLVYFIACTADGFIAREDGSFDFFPLEGGHMDYIREEYPETMPTHIQALLGINGENRHFDTVLMGLNTYAVGLAEGVTSPYAHLRQFVFSRSLKTLASPDITLVADDPLGVVRKLKQEAGRDIWLCGGGSLASGLISEIDELVLKINPVVLGQGIKLFSGLEPPIHLELLEHKPFTGGVAVHRYALVHQAQ